MDNRAYDLEEPASTDFKFSLKDTPEKKAANSYSSSISFSSSTGRSRGNLLLTVLGTFFVTAIVAVAITYPLTKNAYDTPCNAIQPSCPTAHPTSTPGWAPKSTTPSHSSTGKVMTSTLEKTPATTKMSIPSTINTDPINGILRSTSVNTAYGPVEGHVVDMGTGNSLDNILSFKGIPYAKPPGRWGMPTNAEPWTSLVADTFGATCKPGDATFNESCLFLNIYVPMDGSRVYPVMLYIHGGAYQSGASNGFPGHMLAAHDVIVVTANYRLGILGFASGANGTLRGNYGLWDQRQAMKFVQTTIADFGGDPAQVTLFGESAGAASLGLHLLSPQSKGLFQRAILESGNEMTMWAVNTPIDEPDTYITQVAADLGCLNDTTISDMEMVDCLKMVDPDTLTKAPFKCPFCLGFAPVVDGDFIPRVPSDMLKDGDFNDVDIMIGTNRNECNIGLLAVNPLLLFTGMSRKQFESSIVDIIDYFYYVVTGSSENSTRVDELYEAMDFMYTPWQDAYNEDLLKDQAGQICTDFAFAAPTNQVARLHSNKVKVHLYVYDVKHSGLQPFPDWIGIYHSYELAYVFGHPLIANGTQSLKDDVDIDTKRCWTSEDEDWSDYIITLWTNYAKTGEPTPEPVSPPHMAAERWQVFDNSTFSVFYINNQEVGNMPGYRLQQTAFMYDYLWWIARDDHFDNVHSLPDEDVVLEDNKFEHWSVKDISVLNLLEKRLKVLEQTLENTTVSWIDIFGNWSSDISISNGTINLGIPRNKRDVDGTLHIEGLFPTKPPKTLPNPLGKGLLQSKYDSLSDATYLALQVALIPIKNKYGATILTVQNFLDILRTDYPNVLDLLLQFLQSINWQNLLDVGKEAAEFCEVNVVEILKAKFPAVVGLLETLGVLPLNP